MNGSRNQSNNKDLDKNGGSRVVPKVKTNPFMYDTLWLVFIKVEIKWPKVKHSSKTLKFVMKFR